MLKELIKFYRFLIYVLPGVLFLSYYPIIGLGRDGSMNYELSLPLIWLVIFDLVVLIIGWKKKVLISGLLKKWTWLLLPVFLSISILWSANQMRGLLTVGILWLIYFAVFGMYVLRDEVKDEGFREKFWKWFLGSSLLVCAWCVIQCFLDVFGVPREYSLMCEGCTYRSFGFPHPNGFAVEPQFMGNLLLAPAIASVWILLKKQKGSHFLGFGFIWSCFFVIVATLFLTFSRGAIYAFAVAMIFMTMYVWVKEKKILKKIAAIWGVVILAFLFTLNLQGIMAQISPTNDTYSSGVAKVLNHLSLGIIDVREQGKTEDFSEETQALELGNQVVEKPVENFESDFDGYVPESTETRIKLSDVALKLWSKDLKTVLFGVGLGGAGQALYDNGLIEWPKEIVQNQYISLLLETGLVGMALLILSLVLVIKYVFKIPQAMLILALMMAYGISLLFFSGLPNALHIYLLPAIIIRNGRN